MRAARPCLSDAKPMEQLPDFWKDLNPESPPPLLPPPSSFKQPQWVKFQALSFWILEWVPQAQTINRKPEAVNSKLESRAP